MFRTTLFCISIFLICLTPMVAQDALTNESVIKMVTAELGDSVIISMIETQPVNFSLTADSLIALKAAGVSDALLAAMVQKSSAPAGEQGRQAPADSSSPS